MIMRKMLHELRKGDTSSHDISAGDADQLADIPAALRDLARDLYNCEFNELDSVDSSLATCNTEATDWSQSAIQLLQEDGSEDENASDPEVEENNTRESIYKNYSDALDAMEELKLFLAKKKKLGNCLKEVSSLEDKLETYCYEARSMAKQKNMHHFFASASNK